MAEHSGPRAGFRGRFLAATATMAAVMLALAGCGGVPPASAPEALNVVHAANVSTKGAGWLHTDGGTIRDAANKPYVIRAANWFGLETPDCVPHGLWTINLNDGLRQIKSMGFNTIRLPYSNQCITTGKVSSDTNFYANPELAKKTPQQVMDLFIAKSKALGLNVILDRHRPSSAAQSELWYTPQYSEAQWIADWKKLATRYKNEPTVIGFDLHNEPHGVARWGGSNPAHDWHAAATRAGKAVQTVNSKLLIIVEGVEAQGNGSWTWWGGGLADVAKKPVKLTVPNQVVYSPHDYPASVYPQKWFSASNYPANLPGIWDANWGYISKNGIAPVLVGEFGSKLETTSDKQWMGKLVSYLAANGTSFAYWSFNPNSSDTGGLLKSDWRTPETAKLAALKPILRPVAVPTPTQSAAPAPTSKPAPAPTPSKTATPVPGTGSSAVAAKWSLQSSWNGGYVAQISVSASRAVNSWSVTFTDPNVISVANSWGMKCTSVTRKSVTCVGSDWTKTLRKGQTATVGLQVNAPKPPVKPVVTVSAK
ncbi:cellulase family glycosylhydrolase [Arthrobacter sp. Bz4]|uniref:cellulase family glycosylhydrolase n=1 Tax=Arthrobacter sp. Bz4 TaxID=2171979 RepID=UPI000D517728|nr:cellulase family glycosylhydrolase [Arthrobacter sp. Bz4]PVE19403.1 glycosyl hydrolase family 5 [Arthrobacter sp. Bz4]